MNRSRRGLLRATGAGAMAVGWGMGLVGLSGLPGCRRADATALRADLAGGWVGANVTRGHAWRDGRMDAASDGPVRRVHTLIVGAGVAGLSAARALSRGGLDDFAVLDLEDQPGGNARGHRIGGHACPLGAHYLPVPGEQAHEVAQWLEELGLIRRAQGRWVADERHRVHSPHERLFVPPASQGLGEAFRPLGLLASMGPVGPVASGGAPGASNGSDGPAEAGQAGFWRGQWQEGLLPHAQQDKVLQRDLARLSRAVAELAQPGRFALPTWRATRPDALQALDRMSFAQWLDEQGVRAPGLRWWLDYACRDDYGAGLQRVSAWAGLQYLASRHGLDGDADPASNPVGEAALLTWPQGNGWLTEHLAEDLGARWQGGQVVTRVSPGPHDVTVRSVAARGGQAQTWVARQVVLAVPLMMLPRLLDAPPAAVRALQPHLAYAPWLVSNVLLQGGLPDRAGAPLSWDNVPCSSVGVADVPVPSLGYVNARQQELAQPVGQAVLTHYWALGGQHADEARRLRSLLLEDDWRNWAHRVVQDLSRIHPEWPGRIERIDLMRYGHAMVIPVPGLRSHPALAALQGPLGRLHLAHSDLSAYSVFEEAFTHGVRAAQSVLSAVGMTRRMA